MALARSQLPLSPPVLTCPLTSHLRLSPPLSLFTLLAVSPSFSQLHTWDEHDGLASTVTAILSGGFSGFALTHRCLILPISLPLPFAFSLT